MRSATGSERSGLHGQNCGAMCKNVVVMEMHCQQ